jgi:pyruvate,water dikinase
MTQAQGAPAPPRDVQRLRADPSGTILWLDDPRASVPARSGGKGASLGRLYQAGLPVPPGFVVGVEAYRRFVDGAGLGPLVARLVGEVAADNADALADASAALMAAFEAAPVPKPLAEAIAVAWRQLGAGPVAVRSSATAEDLPQASFAGQQDTVLGVASVDAVTEAVRRCWSSLWTVRAVAYRSRQGIDHAQVAAAVVVQRMVAADVAGVLFTADPLTGRRDHVMVEAVRGLGAPLVGGRVTPQRWVVDGSTKTVLSAADHRGQETLLDDARLRELTALGLRAAGLFGDPQDVEWATADDRCWILQSRPITSLFPLPTPVPAGSAGLRVYMPLNLVAQGMTEPFTTAGCAFFLTMATRCSAYWSLRGRERWQATWLPVALGRLFYDVTPFVASPRLAARLPLRLRLKDPAAAAALEEWVDREGGRLPRAPGVALGTGLSVWILRQVPGLLVAAARPDQARRRLLRYAEVELRRLQREAAGRTTAPEQLDFAFGTLPRRAVDLVMAQLPPVYVGLLAGPVAEWLTRRWLGSSAGVEPVRRWLPHDPTLAMGAGVAQLAEACAAAGAEPSRTGPGVREFLATYGHRAPDREIDIGLARFSDDPTYVVNLIRSCLRAGDPGELLGRQRQGREHAAAAVDDLVTAVRRTQGPIRARLLRAVLTRLRGLGGLRERPKFDLVRIIALGRQLLQQVGASLVAEQRLDDAEDVFFLDPADLRLALQGKALDLRVRAAGNRREYEREVGRRAVPRILTSEGETVYGPAAPVEPPAGTLRGTGVSPGVHEGVIRVLESPVGADLGSGEVLVAATTDPGWTPLFLLAGALVMEVGGVVSHGAVVAREYGIPAVAAVPDATRRLRTGQRVRVDGGTGVIQVLDEEGDVAP